MAFQLSLKTKALAQATKITPQIILDIEGVDLIFGTNPVLEVTRWDSEGLEWDSDLFWDSDSPKPESRDYIQLGGTTKNITQQIKVDKGGSSSITTATIQILDKDSEVAKKFSFDSITEILGKRCKLLTGMSKGAYPEDMIPVLIGYITDIAFENGSVYLSIASTEALKRQNLFNKYSSEITQDMLFKDVQIQDITYEQRFKNNPVLSIEYVAGGSTAASIAGNTITITVTGATVAGDILQAIDDVWEVANVIEGQITGDDENIQIVEALTELVIDNTINVVTTIGLIESGDVFRSYIRIEDEIMEVVSIDSDVQLTVVREKFQTVPVTHEADSEIVSFYTLEGNPLDVARKMMLSEEGNPFSIIDIDVKSVNFEVANGILFEYFNIQILTGLEIGDTIQIPSGINAGDYTITGFGTRPEGDSFITMLGLLQETAIVYKASYRSQWNVLPSGLSMMPSEVDLPEFASVQREFGNAFVDILPYFKDTIKNAKEFIDTKILFPQGMYSIIRGARTSVKYTAPPLSIEVLPVLSAANVTNPESIKQKRATYKYLYNEVLYQYNEDAVEDKLLNLLGTLSQESKNRIDIGNKQLKIEAGLLRRSNLTTQAIEIATDRLITRYKFAAQFYSGLKVLYKDFFNIEIGDTVILDGESLKFVNPKTGERNLPLAQYEIVNKKHNVVDGSISLDIVNTGFLLDQRIGVFSPSSEVATGSTVDTLILRETLNTNEFAFEPQRYTEFIGGQIRVRSQDYTFDEIVTIESLSSTNINAINISALSQVPQDGWIFEIPDYGLLDSSEVSELYKLKYTFEMLQAEIDIVTDESNFTVIDATGLFIGQKIQVHSDDYARDSFDVEISNIAGSLITLITVLEFLPVSGDKLETRSFTDGFGYSLR